MTKGVTKAVHEKALARLSPYVSLSAGATARERAGVLLRAAALLPGKSLEWLSADDLDVVYDAIVEDASELLPPSTSADQRKYLMSQLKTALAFFKSSVKGTSQETDMIAFWTGESNIMSNALLTDVAKMYVTVQAASTESERSFSAIGAYDEAERSHLGSRKMAMMATVRMWMQKLVGVAGGVDQIIDAILRKLLDKRQAASASASASAAQ